MTKAAANPLLAPWTGPFEAPPFPAFETAHFEPAFETALAENVAEIAAIADSAAAPTFENTIVALERAGHALDRVSSVFFNLTSTDSDEALQAIEMRMAPRLSRHSSAIYLNAKLFSRIDDLRSRRDSLGLDGPCAQSL